MHSFYANNFNAVDRFNRYFYQLQYPHKINQSDTVALWGILQIAFVDAWALWCELSGEEKELKTFTEAYITEIFTQ